MSSERKRAGLRVSTLGTCEGAIGFYCTITRLGVKWPMIFLGTFWCVGAGASHLMLSQNKWPVHKKCHYGKVLQTLKHWSSTPASQKIPFPLGHSGTIISVSSRSRLLSPLGDKSCGSQRCHSTYWLFIVVGTRKIRGIFNSTCGSKGKVSVRANTSCFNSVQLAPIASC